MSKPHKREKIGEVGVDSGQMLMGDPCYWLDKEAYAAICDEDGQINYEMGHPGKGVKVSTGYGDGGYVEEDSMEWLDEKQEGDDGK